MTEISELLKRVEGLEFYVADFRPEWRKKPCITFWGPKSAGYAWPLPWAGKYLLEELKPGYHEKKEGRSLIRFAVPCHIVDAMGVPTPSRLVDGDAGPVVMNTEKNRTALRTNRLRLPLRALSSTQAEGGKDG